MEKTIYLSKLYDLYSNFLTEKQKEYFKLYYFENLTLDEIADILKISKAGVSKQIKTSENQLKFYEEKLKLLEKMDRLENYFKNEPQILKKIKECLDMEE